MSILVLLLLLLSLQGYAYAEGISNCREGKRVRVIKMDNQYKLQLCISRNNCTDKRNFIRFNQPNFCDVCKAIPGLEKHGKTTPHIHHAMLNRWYNTQIAQVRTHASAMQIHSWMITVRMLHSVSVLPAHHLHYTLSLQHLVPQVASCAAMQL